LVSIWSIDFWQLLAKIVTVFGLPLAIYTFVLEQRKERDNEDEEVYQHLSDAYIDFANDIRRLASEETSETHA